MIRFAAALVGVLLLAAGPAAAADLAREMLSDINAERTKLGLAPLHMVTQLSKVARAHSADMAAHGYFGHSDPAGKRIGERLTDAGYGFLFAGENLSAGLDDPNTVVRQWLMSRDHRHNLLEPRAREAGIGFVVAPEGQYRFYWTLILAEPAQR